MGEKGNHAEAESHGFRQAGAVCAQSPQGIEFRPEASGFKAQMILLNPKPLNPSPNGCGLEHHNP